MFLYFKIGIQCQVPLAQLVEDGPHYQGNPGSNLTKVVVLVIGEGDTLKSSHLTAGVAQVK